MRENTSNEAAEGSPNFLDKAEKLFEALQERDAEDPFSRFLASSPDLDIVNQRGPARLLQSGPQLLGFLASSPDLDIVNQRGPARLLPRGPQLLGPTSESSEDDTLESEDSVNSRASGNSRSEADRSRGKNIGRRTFDRRREHSENTDENVESQQNKAQKRKAPTLDPLLEGRSTRLGGSKRRKAILRRNI